MNQINISKPSIKDRKPKHYTLALMNEAYTTKQISMPDLKHINTQVMLLLKDLILRYTRFESTSVMSEKAESLLNSIYFTLDTYLSSLEDDGLALKALIEPGPSIAYQEGLKRLQLMLENTKLRYQILWKEQLDIEHLAYKTTIQNIAEFFNVYNLLFEAHETMGDIDYPLVFDDLDLSGIHYISHYIETLILENSFCKLFDIERIKAVLAYFGRVYRMDYRESYMNIFESALSQSLFCMMADTPLEQLILPAGHYQSVRMKMSTLSMPEMDAQLELSLQKLIKTLPVVDPGLVKMIEGYKAIFAPRLKNAADTNTLDKLVAIQ